MHIVAVIGTLINYFLNFAGRLKIKFKHKIQREGSTNK